MLKYIGKMTINGIPARNLRDDELEELQKNYPGQDLKAILVRTGLYVVENKSVLGGAENKAQQGV